MSCFEANFDGNTVFEAKFAGNTPFDAEFNEGLKAGEPGLSAYEIAVKNGFEGTEEEWLESLKGGTDFEVDNHTLVLENGVLRVNTTNVVEANNMRPITSAAVHTTVGNIEVLLKTI